jgi:hypothetical protein
LSGGRLVFEEFLQLPESFRTGLPVFARTERDNLHQLQNFLDQLAGLLVQILQLKQKKEAKWAA